MKKRIAAYDKNGEKLKKTWLTNELSCCSYGLPVVSINGIAYSPTDIALNDIRLTAPRTDTVEWGKTQFYNIEFETALDRYNDKMSAINVKLPIKKAEKFKEYCKSKKSNPSREIKKMIDEVLKAL